jgi:hypothetical protein
MEERRDERFGLVHGGLVVLGGAELEEHLGVLDVARELLERVERLLDAGALAVDRLRLAGVVPEPRRERLGVERLELLVQPREVKDAPLAS